MTNTTIDIITSLPNEQIKTKTKTLIGYESKFNRIHGAIMLLMNHDGLIKWSKEKYDLVLPAINSLSDRHPLIIFAGDVGTGKTVMAESIADQLTRELKKEGFFLRLSTRVRGEGLHGEMGNLVNDAFARLKKEAGKKRLAFLLIDEADAIATTRGTQQMHQEEKAGVNTLIQKLDDIRELGGRAVVFMSTNRLRYIDEAIVRRAAVVLEFKRPNENERFKLFKYELKGAKINDEQLKELAKLTGENGSHSIGYSYSDLRLKVLPEALAMAFIKNQNLTFELIKNIITQVQPSPEIK